MRSIQFLDLPGRLVHTFPPETQAELNERLEAAVARPELAPATVTGCGVELSLEWTPTDMFVTGVRMVRRA